MKSRDVWRQSTGDSGLPMPVHAAKSASKKRGALAPDITNQQTILGRDTGPLTSRTSSKGALIGQTHAAFRSLARGTSLSSLKQACLNGSLLANCARHTRERIWEALNWRFFAWAAPRWVIKDLGDAALESIHPSAHFVGLVYLHYVRRDRLTFDFTAEGLFANWYARIRNVRREEVWRFATEHYGSDDVARFRESTRKKIAGNLLSALRDFGVLTGSQHKTIQQPRLELPVAFHLCRLLYAEGLRGWGLLQAPDWKLFLLPPDAVTNVLGRLARNGNVRFEQAGRTVVLELPGDSAPG